MSDESIKPPFASNKMLNPSVNYFGTKTRVKFNGGCFKQDKMSFDHGKIVNIYISFEIDSYVNISIYSTLENGAVKLAKHVGIDLHKYSGYGIGCDRSEFSSIGDDVGRNVIILGVYMNSSSHIDKNKKYILIIGKGPTQG